MPFVSFAAKLHVLLGYASLACSNFHKANFHFLKVPPSLGDAYASIAAGADIAAAAALTTLAAASRDELRVTVLGSPSVRRMLESARTLSDVIGDIVAARYGAALASLATEADALRRSDALLGPFAAYLASQTRRSALTLFLSPYACVNLRAAAVVLGYGATPASSAILQGELHSLIAAGDVGARVDARGDGVLRCHRRDARMAAIAAVAAMRETYKAEVMGLLIRNALRRARIVVGAKPPRASMQQHSIARDSQPACDIDGSTLARNAAASTAAGAAAAPHLAEVAAGVTTLRPQDQSSGADCGVPLADTDAIDHGDFDVEPSVTMMMIEGDNASTEDDEEFAQSQAGQDEQQLSDGRAADDYAAPWTDAPRQDAPTTAKGSSSGVGGLIGAVGTVAGVAGRASKRHGRSRGAVWRESASTMPSHGKSAMPGAGRVAVPLEMLGDLDLLDTLRDMQLAAAAAAGLSTRPPATLTTVPTS